MKRCHCCRVNLPGSGLCLNCHSYIKAHTKALSGLEDLNQDDLKILIRILGAIRGLKKKLVKT